MRSALCCVGYQNSLARRYDHVVIHARHSAGPGKAGSTDRDGRPRCEALRGQGLRGIAEARIIKVSPALAAVVRDAGVVKLAAGRTDADIIDVAAIAACIARLIVAHVKAHNGLAVNEVPQVDDNLV